ncbi:MAG: universal stress protein [Mycobacteriaceae bacterium]
MTPVLAGVDGSASSTAAVRWAAAEAHRRRASLRLVSAFVFPGGKHERDPALGLDYLRVMTRVVEDYLDDARAVALDTAPHLEVTTDVLTGRPADVLIDEATRAQLTVVGHLGAGGLEGLLLGSVGATLAGTAVGPVVVVRGHPGTEPRRPVVVGVDGAHSQAALEFALAHASRLQVPLRAVHTWAAGLLDPFQLPEARWAPIEADERRALDAAVAAAAVQHPEVEVHSHVAVDSAARQLIAESATAQLVVVGAHTRRGVVDTRLGSLTRALLHRAGCPVAVVPNQDEEP